jgi:hypothetical protein
MRQNKVLGVITTMQISILVCENAPIFQSTNRMENSSRSKGDAPINTLPVIPTSFLFSRTLQLHHSINCNTFTIQWQQECSIIELSTIKYGIFTTILSYFKNPPPPPSPNQGGRGNRLRGVGPVASKWGCFEKPRTPLFEARNEILSTGY